MSLYTSSIFKSITRNHALPYAFFSVLLFLDQLSKYLVRKSTASYKVVPNFFSITLTKNSGSVFGSFKENNSLLIWISIIMIGFLLYNYDDLPNYLNALLLAGITGNLLDRIFLGYVTDFIDFPFWYVFNFADTYLSIGVALALLLFIKGGFHK